MKRALLALGLVYAAAADRPSAPVQNGAYYVRSASDANHCFRLTFSDEGASVEQDYGNDPGNCNEDGFGSSVSLGDYSSFDGNTEYYTDGTFAGGCTTSDGKRKSSIDFIINDSGNNALAVSEPSPCTYVLAFTYGGGPPGSSDVPLTDWIVAVDGNDVVKCDPELKLCKKNSLGTRSKFVIMQDAPTGLSFEPVKTWGGSATGDGEWEFVSDANSLRFTQSDDGPGMSTLFQFVFGCQCSE